MATPHKLVSPDGVLHLVPRETKPFGDFCDAHGLRCHWHEEILKWCATIFRKDRGAYELMWSGQMLLLPHPDTIRKRCAAHVHATSDRTRLGGV